MREIVDRYNVYKFEELSEDAKKEALLKYYDINVEYDWWDNTYSDIKNSFRYYDNRLRSRPWSVCRI